MLGEQTEALHMFQGGATSKKGVGTYNKYTLEERVKMGRHGAGNGPSKVMKHFSLLLDGKLTCNRL